jgi:formate/nitrite transporter FocA (FNT family)
VIGGASIPISFTINSSPVIVWLGNALGSVLSAIFVIFVGNRVTDKKFMKKISKWRLGRKVSKTFTEGQTSPRVAKVRKNINKHGLRIFALFCPIFPGVLISTSAVYLLGLDKKTYKRWMLAGVVFVSGIYVFGYWLIFIK